MEDFLSILDMLRGANLEDGVFILLACGLFHVGKWLKANPWTLNVTKHEGKLNIAFRAEKDPASLPTRTAKCLPVTKQRPASKK